MLVHIRIMPEFCVRVLTRYGPPLPTLPILVSVGAEGLEPPTFSV